MADFTTINQEIDNNIKQNGVNAITGQKLNTVLKDMMSAVNTEKQDTIDDLAEIRTGAEAGAAAYQMPEEGIPSRDLSEGVQKSLENADNAVLYEEQSTKTDQQRNTALANVSNQTANSTTGKMGYKVLDPTKTFASQVTETNTIYEIRDVFDLGGTSEIPVSVTIPSGCTLNFNGGSITGNGTLIGTNTIIKAPNYEIFKHGTIKYRGYKSSQESPTREVSKVFDGIFLDGTFTADKIGTNWTGLENIGSEPADCAFRNYITLHKDFGTIIIPKGTYYVFSIGTITTSIDFSNSMLYLLNASTIYDNTIPLPEGSTESALNVPQWVMAFSKTNGTIKNFSFDGMFNEYHQTDVGLGSHSVLEMFSNSNMRIENVKISNYASSAIITHAPLLENKNNGILLKNVKLDTIGEHGIYCHTQGDVVLEDCSFINCSYNAEIGSRIASIINFAGTNGFYEGSYVALTAKNCIFSRDNGYIDPTGTIVESNSIKKCLLNYDGASSYQFEKCSFKGEGLLGFQILSNSSTYYNKEIEVIFKNCSNIIHGYASSGNYIVKVYDCKEVRKPLLCDYIENSKCYFGESTITSHRNVALENKEYVRCDFIEGDNLFHTVINIDNTNFIFKDCNFYSTTETHYSAALVYINDYSNITFDFTRVVFNIPVRLFVAKTKGNNVVTFNYKDCKIEASYPDQDHSIVLTDSADVNINVRIDNVNKLGVMNTPIGLGITSNPPTNLRLLSSPGGPIQPRPLANDIGVIWFNGTKPLYWNGTNWVDATGATV